MVLMSLEYSFVPLDVLMFPSLVDAWLYMLLVMSPSVSPVCEKSFMASLMVFFLVAMGRFLRLLIFGVSLGTCNRELTFSCSVVMVSLIG